MNDADIRFNKRLSVLVLASFALCVIFIVLRLGLGATDYGTTDSAGRAMGFNDLLSAEHYGIMVRNFSFAALLKPEAAYEWVLLAMHAVGAGLLFFGNRVSLRLTRWFFAIQALLFPIGIPALLILPLIVMGLVTGDMDREGFIDIPFIICTAHPVWVLTSFTITILMRGPGLGLVRLREVFSHGYRTGLRTLGNAVR